MWVWDEVEKYWGGGWPYGIYIEMEVSNGYCSGGGCSIVVFDCGQIFVSLNACICHIGSMKYYRVGTRIHVQSMMVWMAARCWFRWMVRSLKSELIQLHSRFPLKTGDCKNILGKNMVWEFGTLVLRQIFIFNFICRILFMEDWRQPWHVFLKHSF